MGVATVVIELGGPPSTSVTPSTTDEHGIPSRQIVAVAVGHGEITGGAC